MQRQDSSRPSWRYQRDNIVAEEGQDPYRLAARFEEGDTCADCHATFVKGRWTWQAAKPGANEARCPACRRIADDYLAGQLQIRGAFVRTHRPDIDALIDAEARTETAEHPLHRIGRIEDVEDGVSVRTTDAHLARRLGEALLNAYEGDLELTYPPEEETVQVTWRRDDEHPPAAKEPAHPWPVEIVDEGVIVDPEANRYLQERIAQLGHFYDRIQAVRVTLESMEGHHRRGGPYRVGMRIEVPGPDIIVTRQQADQLHVAIRGAFDAGDRRLQDHIRKLRERVLPGGDDRQWGHVTQVFREAGYGFIQAEDGHELYFNRNSLIHGEFDELGRGDRVRYHEEAGDKGPQASSVST